jgi:DNA polymerase III delta subunit
VPAIGADAFIQQIRKRRPEPVYVIIGDDDREKSALSQLAAELVDEELRAFNVERMYGTDKSTTAESIVEAARILPMLGDRRVIVVLRADPLVKPKRRKADAEEDDAAGGEDGAMSADALTAYVSKPEPMTTLVIVADDIDRGRKLGKALVKQAAVVECWGLKPGKEVRGADLYHVQRNAQTWITTRASEAGKTIEPAGVSLLASRAGIDISTLRGDWERLLLYVGARATITREDVSEIASSETSQDDWAVINALRRGDVAMALRELSLSLDAGAAPQQVLGQLGHWARTDLPGMSARHVRPAVDALLRTDLELKSSAGEPRVLLERLVVELARR